MDLGLRGHTAFVAAASRGLGRATALCFADEGCDVGLCARDQRALEEVAADCRSRGVTAVPVVADVTDAAAVGDAIGRVVSATGRLDALVVNSGGPPPGGFADTGDEGWRQAVELTLMSAVHLVRAALPALRRSHAASIVFLASMSVQRPIPGLLLSNAVRAGVDGLARTLAVELAPQVRVNSVLTGRIRTERTELLARHRHPEEDPEAVLAREAAAIPMRRFGTTDELARAAVLLSSPVASYITGVALPVDGGVIAAG